MVNSVFEKAIQELEVDRQRRVDAARQKVLTEQVAPHNRETDASLAEALSEIQAQYTAKVAAIKQDYDQQKADLSSKAAKNKTDFAEAAIAAATAEINTEIDRAIAHLRGFISGRE